MTEDLICFVVIGDNKLSSDRDLAILSRSKGNRQLTETAFTQKHVYTVIWTYTRSQISPWLRLQSPFPSQAFFTVNNISSI